MLARLRRLPMTRDTAIGALLVAWGFCFGMGFAAFTLLPATGEGFTHGINLVTAFLAWHLSAAAVAVCAAFFGIGSTGAWIRHLSRLPAMIALAELSAIYLFILNIRANT